MQRHEIVHEIHCAPERLWELYFDNDFNVEMYEQGMGFPSCKILERKVEGDKLHRKMAVVPKVDMPKPVAKLVGDRVGFEEIGDWIRSEGVFRFRIVLAAFGDKVQIKGKMRVVPQGEARCRRLVEFEIEAKMFGIGKLVEKTASDNTLDGWNKSAKWINEYLARGPA